MKEFKFTGTMRPERILPNDRYVQAYRKFRADVVRDFGQSYPIVEVIVRVRDLRQDWIDKWYTKACYSDCSLAFRKDVVVAAGYGKVATAAPVRGDKYNRHTGIAVAYAKLIGEPVPDYI